MKVRSGMSGGGGVGEAGERENAARGGGGIVCQQSSRAVGTGTARETRSHSSRAPSSGNSPDDLEKSAWALGILYMIIEWPWPWIFRPFAFPMSYWANGKCQWASWDFD